MATMTANNTKEAVLGLLDLMEELEINYVVLQSEDPRVAFSRLYPYLKTLNPDNVLTPDETNNDMAEVSFGDKSIIFSR